jgi:hypothetical protein
LIFFPFAVGCFSSWLAVSGFYLGLFFWFWLVFGLGMVVVVDVMAAENSSAVRIKTVIRRVACD